MASPCSTTCAALAAAFPAQVQLPGSPGYVTNKTSYFAAFENEVSPSCLIQPRSSKEVAALVQIAVRSGGHTAWAGSANIEEGITIDLSGGLSYFSAETGFVCDNVINYEVVLASGEIVQANKHSYPDLFVALKGGSNNFGIVTRLEFPTFELGQMWGGAVFYDKSAYSSLVKAFNDFSFADPQDTPATIILASTWIPGTGEISVSNLYHSTPAVTPPTSLQPFVDIQPQLSNTLRQDSLLGFADEQSDFSTNGARQWFFTTSFRVDVELLLAIHDLWLKAVESLQTEPGVLVSLVFHPVTTEIIIESLKRADNSLGMSPADGPFVICLLNTVHVSPTSDHAVSTIMLQLIEQIDSLATERNLASRYRFLNYGYASQQILQGYGAESIARLKAASQTYDPTGFFQNVVPGGYKISKV